MMKKDKKWLKEAFGELNLVEAEFKVDGLCHMDTAVNVTQVYDLIDQLDEPEVLSQEWIRENQERKDIHFYVSVIKLQNLLVPKQELPVVPKHVGEWITRYREKYDLYPALRLLENNTLVWGEIYEWYRMNTHKFVNAYLTGEYEEEPLYHALIKGHEVSSSCDIYWNYDKYDDDVFVSRLYPTHDNFLTEMSKLEWVKLGINDSNADFVEVDGRMEE